MSGTRRCRARRTTFRTWHVRICLSLLLVLLWGPSAAPIWAASSWAGEYELKSAFVYNIIPFVDWPKSSLGDHLLIGFAGDEPAPDAIVKFFNGKRVGKQLIEVRTVHSRNEMRTCQVLLLAYHDSSRTRAALAQLEGTSVLSIGDGEPFARQGGVMSFLRHENTLQLGINPQAADRAGLRISAKLMQIAKLLSDER